MSRLLSPVWSQLGDFQVARGEGVNLYDTEGNRYLDFTSGIGVINTGHSHPRVVQAVQEQAQQLIFSQINTAYPKVTVDLAEELVKYMPDPLDCFFFTNSGAEAVEASVKLARHATGRTNLIVFQGSFHGRTHQTMAMNASKTVYGHNYLPLPSGVFVAPFPHGDIPGSEEERVRFCLEQVEYLLRARTAPDQTAAMIIEPVLGEGGYIPAPAAFLEGLREICDRHGILLIFDEVQTGVGRTGKMFALEHYNVTPDILVMAKGLGSGLPISAIASPRHLMERWEPGTHGGTYGGGSALPLAAARETLRVMAQEDLPGNAQRMGEYLRAGLRKLQEQHEAISDVRGLGLMVGVELRDADGKPDKALTKAVQRACVDNGLLILTCGMHENVIRWIPPLVVSEAQLDEALAIFARAVEQQVAPVPA